jgi:GIY-YIG catalytic domain
MHYVYILQAVAVPGHFYIGSTDNLRQRLRQHQADVDSHAAKYRPWKLKTAFAHSFLAGYTAARPAFGYPDKRNPPKGRKRRAEGPRQRPGGGPKLT